MAANWKYTSSMEWSRWCGPWFHWWWMRCAESVWEIMLKHQSKPQKMTDDKNESKNSWKCWWTNIVQVKSQKEKVTARVGLGRRSNLHRRHRGTMWGSWWVQTCWPSCSWFWEPTSHCSPSHWVTMLIEWTTSIPMFNVQVTTLISGSISTNIISSLWCTYWLIMLTTHFWLASVKNWIWVQCSVTIVHLYF